MYYEMIYSRSKQQWYFRLVAANGQIIVWSEYYRNKADAEHAMHLVMDTTRLTPVKETVVP